MNIDMIEKHFKSSVSDTVEVFAEGIDRYRVFAPFQFDDGDGLVIVLKRDCNRWILSDEAHTYMRFTYDIDESDLHRGRWQRIISNALSMFHVEDRDGELVLDVADEMYGDALFSFVQAILKISDVSYLSRETTLSTFLEDFREMLVMELPDERRKFDWHDPELDPNGIYKVDCRINGMERPLFVHALNNDRKTQEATISLLQFEKW